ncbi:hypothetical protein [Vineibacter terrae]|uniref:hypothetical protein n=1 Tax=Vineibacter terrae TaxID=2586908 RepID=UPI002E2F9F49|nr:hypothetical protein [Vineibacter terrae]HEX2890780.1 hypothetical protein [Vineibacter terrae]
MLRLKLYPITISGSTLDEDFRSIVTAIGPWLSATQQDWLLRRSNRLDFVNDPRAPAQRYEEDIRALIEAHLLRTEIGKTLFGMLPKDLRIWIIPYDSMAQTSFGACNAITSQMSSRLSDGVRILYSPETWAYSACGRLPGYRADETLFHEMVHACRLARFGFEGNNHEPLRDNKDHEEFLAVQMSNVYRSEGNAKTFNHAYMTSKLGTQAEVERTLSAPDFVKAIEGFLDDPFVAAVAKINTAFNPFRDIARLKAQAEPLEQQRKQQQQHRRK